LVDEECDLVSVGDDVGPAGSEESVPARVVTRAQVLPGLRLTARDLEILEFINDMRFANLETIHLRFFGTTRTGEKSKSTWWARERIQHLRKYQLIRAVRYYTEGQSYFVTTAITHLILQGKRPERIHPTPLETIDNRSFEHDKMILYSRVMLELSGRARDWQSERWLKAESSLAGTSESLSREMQPDAIYTNKRGEKVAFELELSTKSRERYKRKFSAVSTNFQLLIYSEQPFSRCLIVAGSKPLFKFLREILDAEVGRENGRFLLTTFESLMRPLREPAAVASVGAEHPTAAGEPAE
jgi:hypothetical protein